MPILGERTRPTALPASAEALLSLPFGLARGVGSGPTLSAGRDEAQGLICGQVTVTHGGSFAMIKADDAWHLLRVGTGALRLVLRTGGRRVQVSPRAPALVQGRELAGGEFAPGTTLECLSWAGWMLAAALGQRLDAPAGRALVFRDDTPPDPCVVGVLFHLSRAWQLACAGHPRLTPMLHSALLDALLQGLPHNHSESLAGRSRQALSPGHVKRAAEYMTAHAACPLTLGEIAKAAGASPRTLQLAFKRFHDCTPLEYLRNLRLAGARRDLTDPSCHDSVATIAARWGFSHQGMFSARYRAAYGELPSQTLTRRR